MFDHLPTISTGTLTSFSYVVFDADLQMQAAQPKLAWPVAVESAMRSCLARSLRAGLVTFRPHPGGPRWLIARLSGGERESIAVFTGLA